jgi:hypothetical protein
MPVTGNKTGCCFSGVPHLYIDECNKQRTVSNDLSFLYLYGE